jgi:hypothetical protein
MKPSPRIILAIMTIVLVSLACRVDIQLTDEPPTFTPIQQELSENPPTEYPTVHPTITAQPPTVEPETAASPWAPAGFLAAMDDGNQVNVFNTQGQLTGSIQTPGMNFYNQGGVHVAGDSPGGVVDDPALFLSYADNFAVRMNAGGEITNLVQDQNLSYMVGAPGSTAFVYTIAQWNGEALVSYLKARTVAGGGASYDMERTDPQSYAVQPLAVQASDSEPHGVWFSLMPYGIGGDIVFAPRRSLYYLDIQAGGTENLYLSEDYNPQGMSPDLTWVAYIPLQANFEEGTTPLTLYNLYSTQRVEIPLRPGSNRGAGNAVFSPDNQYVAWMEGSGWMMAETPNFHSRVLIADINGNILADLPDSAVAAVTGTPQATWVQPVGWLDAETVIIEVRGDNWNKPTLVSVRFDGSNMNVLTNGVFSGFIYP